MVIFSLTALILYLSASVVVLRRLLSSGPAGWSFYLVAASAMLLHGTGIADPLWNTTKGQDMSLLNVASAVSLLISMVLIFMLLAIFFLMRQILRVLLSI